MLAADASRAINLYHRSCKEMRILKRQCALEKCLFLALLLLNTVSSKFELDLFYFNKKLACLWWRGRKFRIWLQNARSLLFLQMLPRNYTFVRIKKVRKYNGILYLSSVGSNMRRSTYTKGDRSQVRSPSPNRKSTFLTGKDTRWNAVELWLERLSTNLEIKRSWVQALTVQLWSS